MKSVLKITLVALIAAAAPTAFAGVEKFNSDEFNSIIADNLTAERQLRDDLHTAGGMTDTQKELDPNFAQKGREMIGVVEAESIVAPTTEHSLSPKKDKSEKRMLERNLKRVSQELESLDAE